MTAERKCAVVAMPEGGVYVMRIDAPESPEDLLGRRVATLLEYGIDEGRVTDIVPQRDGLPPGFAVLRIFSQADAEACAANAIAAKALGEELSAGAEGRIPGFRLYSARLSLGKRRLFVRFSASPAHVPPERLARAFKKRPEFSIDARQLGPRDIAAETGCAGECGRICCRAKLKNLCRKCRTAPPPKPSPRDFGTCGCLKCCLGWEDGQAGGPGK